MKKQTKTKEKKKKGGLGKKVLWILLLLLIIGGAVFAYKAHQNGGGIGGVIRAALNHNKDTVNTLPKMYCLLVGKSQNLTDTIMLASYDPKTQQAALLSIPRDTFIGEDKATATSWDKINAVYQNDGMEGLLKQVRKITGINVQYYVLIDTQALRALVDEIDGVEFDVPIDMNYDSYKQDLHIHLEKGVQLLDGDKAEQVVRFRHNNDGSTYPYEYGMEDLGRMKTQRAFLTALAKQTLVPQNLTKIPEFIEIAKEYVTTNLNFDAIKDYVPYAIEFDTQNLKTDKLPGVAEYANIVSIYSLNEDEVEEVVNDLFFSEPEKDLPSNEGDGNIIEGTEGEKDATNEGEISSEERAEINIEILNGTGLSTNLSEAKTILENAGYNVSKTSKTTTTATTAIINRGEVSERIENDIQEILKTGVVSNGQSSGTTDITIILGTDYVM